MTNISGLLIIDVSDEELDLLRAVRDTDFAGAAREETIARAVDRGLIDRVAGSYGGFSLATPGLHTLWKHDRPAGLDDAPWERCRACGHTNLVVQESWQATAPTRADCQTCGYKWTAAAA
jgi:hypothetical protein